MFSYDRKSSPDLVKYGIEYRNGTSICDIRFAGLAQEKIKAYLVMPSGSGPFAGIVFLHPGPGSRSTFLDEALILAGKGASSLLIEAPWADGPAFGMRASGKPEDVREWFKQITIDLRRAIDLISSIPSVDKDRIACVGHSIGALFAGILSGSDERINASVLMAGVGSFTDVAALNMPGLVGDELERYRQIMQPIDPVGFVRNAAPSALFFQFGLQDVFFPKQNFLDFFAAGSEPKVVQWYDADHYSLNEAGRSDRIEWLKSVLALKA